MKYNIYASQFTPIRLSDSEQKTLEAKLTIFEAAAKKERTVRMKGKRSSSNNC